jgi:hypothetical protein
MNVQATTHAAHVTNPPIVNRGPDAAPFTLHRAAPTRYDLLASAARLGSPNVKDAIRTILDNVPNAPLPFASAAHSEAMALDCADLVEAWADNSKALADNPADVLALAMIRWSGRKLATMGIIPHSMVA